MVGEGTTFTFIPCCGDDDDYEDDGDDDDEYNGLSARLGHMCPNPQNGLFQCF